MPDTVTRTQAIGDVVVRYASRPAKRDTRELVVVFTSIHDELESMDFGGPDGPTLAANRAELLFVHDAFADTYCYCMCRDRRFDVADAVVEFLDRYRRERGLEWSQVTLAGMSKGGSAALYLGLRVPDVAIVANAPQLRIGRYLDESHRDPIAHTMAGAAGADRTAWLDAIMPDALEANAFGNQHLYLFTGTGDANCYDELAGHAQALTSFTNSSVVVARNSEVLDGPPGGAHHRTLLYFIPQMVSLLGLLGTGARPALGFTDLTRSGRARVRGGRAEQMANRIQRWQLRRHLRAQRRR